MALNESGGTAGGYLTMPEPTIDDKPEKPPDKIPDADLGDMEQVKADVQAIGAQHLGDGEGHAIHVHPPTGQVHHSHPADFDPEKLGVIKGELEKVHGVKGVDQEPDKPNPPDGQGWEHAFGIVKDAEEEDEEAEPPEEIALDVEEEEPEGEAEAKAFKDRKLKIKANAVKMVKRMPAIVLKHFLAGFKAKASTALQECVSRKIPKLLEEGYSQEQAAAIAFSVCGESKAMSEEGGVDPNAVPGGMNPDEDAADENLPFGVAHAKKTIGLHEKAMPKMHPNDKMFYKASADMTREHAKSEYPEHAVHIGETGAQPSLEPSQAEEDLSHYKSGKLLAAKMLAKRMKKAHAEVIKAATQHLGELAELPVGEKWKSTHKTATGSHYKAMSGVCKDMDGGEEDDTMMLNHTNGISKQTDVGAIADNLGKALEEAFKAERYKITGKREDKPLAASFT